MSSKPETRFIKSVHDHIPRVYKEKMNNPFRCGTADVWYSGVLGDLWIEYKYVERIPKNAEIIPEVTSQQAKWLGNRFDEGRNVAVVLGVPTGGVIYRDREWLKPLDPEIFISCIVSRKAIAQWILAQVGVSKCQLLK